MPDQAEAYRKARTGYKAIVFDDQDLTNDFNKIQNGVLRTRGKELMYPDEDIASGLRVEYTALNEPFVKESLET